MGQDKRDRTNIAQGQTWDRDKRRTGTNEGQNVGQGEKRRTGTNVGQNVGQGQTWDRDKRGTGTNIGQGQT